MTVVLATRNEPGKRELIDRGRSRVAQALADLDLIDKFVRKADPAQAHARSESLRSGGHVCDARRVESLDGTDCSPVVAELRVVIILDHQGARGFRPLQKADPSLRCHDRSGRKLMRRSYAHRVDTQPGELSRLQTAIVHRTAYESKPRLANRLLKVRRRRCFHRDRGSADHAGARDGRRVHGCDCSASSRRGADRFAGGDDAQARCRRSDRRGDRNRTCR